jgi:hypothetical protein
VRRCDRPFQEEIAAIRSQAQALDAITLGSRPPVEAEA